MARKDDTLSILQEYVPSQTLEMLIKDRMTLAGGISEQLVAKYAEGILHGMEFLHQREAAHGSIKAANVFVSDDGSCKLADFGRVRQICEASTSRQSKFHSNPPYWTAPELIGKEDRPAPSRFSDVWSLGCTVYEMVVGQPPWFEENELTLLMTIACTESGPRCPDSISAALKDFLDCCF